MVEFEESLSMILGWKNCPLLDRAPDCCSATVYLTILLVELYMRVYTRRLAI
jgi:hypothetical protein